MSSGASRRSKSRQQGFSRSTVVFPIVMPRAWDEPSGARKLLLAENFPNYSHIQFEQQRKQGHVLACCDDLAEHRHVNGAQDECRFVAQVRRSGKGYALSLLNEDGEAGLIHCGIARTRCSAAVQGEAWYRGCWREADPAGDSDYFWIADCPGLERP